MGEVKRFWKLVLARVIVAWLSPSALLLLSLTFMAWKIWPDIGGNCRPGQPCGIVHKTNNGIDTVVNETKAVTRAMVDVGRPGKPETMGLIPAAREVALETGAGVRLMNQQVTQSATLISAATGAVDGVSVRLQGTADAMTGSLGELQTDLKLLGITIGQLNDGSNGVGATMANVNGGVTDFRDYLKSEAMERFQNDLLAMTGNLADGTAKADLILGDLYHASHPYLNPEPCKTGKCKFGRFLKTSAGYIGFAGDARRAASWWLPYKIEMIP